MAGDFVMVQCSTPRKPEVMRVADILGIEPAHAFGLCVIGWMWFDEQTEDGRASGATASMLDAVVGRSGFADALHQVGWLQVREGSLVVPRFEQHMGQSAKKRAKNSARQQRCRQEKVSRDERDESVTKEKNRREEKKETTNVVSKPPTPLEIDWPKNIDGPECRKAWSDWLAYRKEAGIKPYKGKASVEKQLKRLAEWGPRRMAAAIEYSIAQGWQGIFEEDRKTPSLFRQGAGQNYEPGTTATAGAII